MLLDGRVSNTCIRATVVLLDGRVSNTCIRQAGRSRRNPTISLNKNIIIIN